MSIATEAALRAWINGRSGLTGDGNPLSRGAYLREQRSPADGAYAVIARGPAAVPDLIAEDSLTSARLDCAVYAGTEQAAEAAAAALRSAFESLSAPEPCPGTDVVVMVADNFTGPVHVPMAADSGEIYCFQVGADFVLTGSGG